MENILLQPLLKAGLLDIGDSDERLSNIEKSIADLEVKLKEDISLLPGYTLIALDPNIGDNEPVLIDVESIISTHWKALRAKFNERPVPIIRAVILNALYNIGISDATIARIIYLTATNFYPYAKLGREKEIVEKLLTELGDLAEKHASSEWSLIETNPELKLTSLKFSTSKSESPKISKENLEAGLLTAIKNDPTGHGVQHGGNSQWGIHFASKSSEAILKALSDGFSEVGKSLSSTSIETPVNKFFGEFKKSLDEILKSSFLSIQAVERRSKLLWWKETLYSSSLKNSYRTIDPGMQPIIMAFDLYEQLPEITPVSVDFLLMDSLFLLNDSANNKKDFSSLLSSFIKQENIILLKNYFNEVDDTKKRICFTDFISLLIYGKVGVSDFKKYTGIEETAQVSFTDLSVMLLHDLMTQYLVKK